MWDIRNNSRDPCNQWFNASTLERFNVAKAIRVHSWLKKFRKSIDTLLCVQLKDAPSPAFAG